MSNKTPGSQQTEFDALKAEVQELRELDRRVRDAIKMGLGLLVGVCALLVTFAWYAGHRTYQNDRDKFLVELDKGNKSRADLFHRQLEGILDTKYAQRDQAVQQRIAALKQELATMITSQGVGSATNLTAQNEELTRKIALMAELIERRYADAFGLVYRDHAIALLRSKYYAVSCEYFAASALAFLKADDDGNLNNVLTNLIRYGLPGARQRDFAARPSIAQKMDQLLAELDRANAQGKHQVALLDLRRLYLEARQRP